MHHTIYEDLDGLVTGTFIAGLGIYFLKSGGIVTGGTAGIALLLSYLFSVSFGILYFLINLPFLILAIWKKGFGFTIKSLISVAMVGVFVSLDSHFLGIWKLNQWFASISGNLLAGVGVLILFRHHSSLGGINIIALLAQEKLNWRAGYVQMIIDGMIVVSALAQVSVTAVLISIAGVAILNITLALNHKPGRYLGY